MPEGEEIETEVETQEGDAVETEIGEKPVEEAQREELVISIGDEQVNKAEEEPQEEEVQKAPAWVKKTRELNRKLEKEKRDLEKDLRETKQRLNEMEPKKEPELGPEPTLEDEDVQYDTEKFKKKMAAYIVQEQAVNAKKEEAEAEERKEQERWQAKQATYQKARTEIKVSDYEEAEAVVKNLLNVTQQGILLDIADDPAVLVYAIGKSPAKAKELAEIKNPIAFTKALTLLEAKVKVEKKPAVSPERRISGNAGLAGVTDNHLERLRDEAAKTGDSSKVIAYKEELRRKRGA